MNSIHFREVQAFSRNAIARWAGIAALAVMALAGALTWPHYREPVALAISLGVGALLTVLLVAGRMETEVNDAGVFVRVFPFTRRHHFHFDQIATVEARTYRPIAEYGGWGIRYSWNSGKAYNVHGDRGVQLTLGSGKKLLLGSQRAEELARAIRSGMAR